MLKVEKQLLLEIKQQFGWPLDLFRYGFSDFIEFWDGKTSTVDLSPDLRHKWEISINKIKYAEIELRKLFNLSWVKGVFITGSVASLNANEEDDIDIWFIVDEKRIWLTRTFDFLVFLFSNKRRLASDGVDAHKINNKFCFNLYTVDGYEFERKTPSYAIQLMDAIPIYLQSPSVYQHMLQSNKWVKEFFPTWFDTVYSGSRIEKTAKEKSIKQYVLDFFEYIAGVLMLLKSKKKLTLSKSEIFVPIFTTWQTTRILSAYDKKVISKGNKKKE